MSRLTPIPPVGRFALVAGLVLLAACRDRGPDPTFARLEIEWIDAEKRVHVDRAPQYDFGTVFMGQSATRTMVVQNNGRVPLRLVSLAVTSGDAELVTLAVDETGKTFRVPFSEVEIGVGGSRDIEIVYSPPVDDSVASHIDHEVQLTLTTLNGVEDESTAVITLKGRAVSGACEIETPVDFGWVAKNNTMRKEVEICNKAPIEATAFIDSIQSNSGDDLTFRFAAESAQGTVAIPPGACTKAVIEFTPTLEKGYHSSVYMQASERCPLIPIELTGRGVDAVLRWRVENLEKCKDRDAQGVCQDNFIDCGAVTPNKVGIERVITLENMGTNAVDITALRFNANESMFTLKAEDGSVPTQVEVPARANGAESPGEAVLTAICRPLSPGLVGSTLLGTVDGQEQKFHVQAKVVGGGPEIDTVPSTLLNFGPVAYFEEATPPAFQERRVIIRNSGSVMSSDGPESNLHLGLRNPDGSRSPPYWEVVPGKNTDASEFTVTLDGVFPENGLAVRQGQNSIAARVRVTPLSIGVKEATLRIFSNDPATPIHEITLTADSRVMPPCQFNLSPAEINFGMVSPGSVSDRAFVFRNLGAPGEPCLVSNIQIAAGSHPAFRLPEHPASETNFQEVDGGETVSVMVRTQPEGEASGSIKAITGEVELYVSSPTSPQVKVPLRADLGVACLTIAPNDLDFGTVQVACNSAVRPFNIYNTCASPITVLGVTVPAAAGLPGKGGEACPGEHPCPEFFLVSMDTLGGGKVLNPGELPIKFQVKYKPIDFGTDIGAVSVSALQNGVPVNYMATLRGTGDTVGRNTDVYGQEQRRKADILFVIDNSCSMQPYQTALGANFDSFIKYARESDVDFHLAATSTDHDGHPGNANRDPSDDGRFRPVPVSGEKFLTKRTADVEAKFNSLVTSFGIKGGGDPEQTFRPAHTALTTLSTTDNAGFLRSDALLAIVGLSDEEEQSDPETAEDWSQLLANIKGVNRSHLFTFNMIGPYEPIELNEEIDRCKTTTLGGNIMRRYEHVVHATGGLEASICEKDWKRVLEEIGKYAVGYRTEFSLNSVPDLSGTNDIKVTITDDDGVVTEVPATSTDGTSTITNWTYDSLLNLVKFDPFAIPEPGETLAITYTTVCYGD